MCYSRNPSELKKVVTRFVSWKCYRLFYWQVMVSGCFVQIAQLKAEKYALKVMIQNIFLFFLSYRLAALLNWILVDITRRNIMRLLWIVWHDLKLFECFEHFVFLLQPSSDPVDGLWVQVNNRDHHTVKFALQIDWWQWYEFILLFCILNLSKGDQQGDVFSRYCR